MAIVQTASFSGKAFSVKNARGKFRSPCGQAGSGQKVRIWEMARRMSSGDSASPNAGMCRSRARTGPPSWTTANQSGSGSPVAKAQSLKSGRGASKPTTERGDPLPSGPWQVAQAVRYNSSAVR